MIFTARPMTAVALVTVNQVTVDSATVVLVGQTDKV